MSHISYLHVKRVIFVLPLLLLLALFLVGCGNSNSATSTSGSSASQTIPTTSQNQNGLPSAPATNVANGDQTVQSLLQSANQAQQDADNAANGSTQDNNPNP